MFDDAALANLREILARRPAVEIDAPQHRRACVLIPLIRNGAGYSVLLTRRSENLASHSGQIAFPGGSVEAGETLEAAVIRETYEEVGIPPDRVELIGRLDDLITHSGFLVAPFAGVIHERVEYVL
ncbi:MAG TPA: CoA pyrophosphatase, partial [Thermoanaerobaculia bacterium]|nr:CoA pyrophosphatase [Thermoanaerobaculia bacterium]